MDSACRPRALQADRFRTHCLHCSCRGLPLRSPLVAITRTLGGGGGSRQLDPEADRAVRRLRKWRKMLGAFCLRYSCSACGEANVSARCLAHRGCMCTLCPKHAWWLAGAGGQDWKAYLARSPRKVQRRVRKGIPDQLRGLAWQLISGGRTLLLRHEGALLQGWVPRSDRVCRTCPA